MTWARQVLRCMLVGLCMLALIPRTFAQRKGPRALIKGGVFAPMYPASPREKTVRIESFYLDRYPVTNAEFLAFVQKRPKWSRDNVTSLFADTKYLSHWAGSTSLGPNALAKQPVTYVSWFAANAYCEWKGARLPREDEWEYAAQASAKSVNGRADAAWRQRVLGWYTKPNPPQLGNVGSGLRNYWGVYDLHGLVWEWVLDFNRSLVSGENREGGDEERDRFCGAGALSADEKEDYPSFMRIAFRSSLKASYTTGNLGFRCAANIKETP